MSPAPIELHRLGRRPYQPVWEAMRELTDCRDEHTPDQFWLVEHDPVFTQGQAGKPEHLLMPGDIPVVNTDRGGQVTYHGPGQLVGYPILRLAEPIDVVHYVRTLEEVLIAACGDLGVSTGRVEGRSGVWLPATADRPERKIAAIGVRVTRWVSWHGIALNVEPDLSHYGGIVPCGISGHGVTSLVDLGVPATMDDADEALRISFRRIFGETARMRAMDR